MDSKNSEKKRKSKPSCIPKPDENYTSLEELTISFSLVMHAKIIEDFELKASTNSSENETFFSREQIVSYLNADLKDIPSVNQIFLFTFSLYDSANLSEECLILALIYILKVLKTSEIKLFSGNWQIILIAATLTSLRVCNEAHYCNLQLENFFTGLSADQIFDIEGEFSHLIESQYEVDLSFFEKCFEMLCCIWEEESQNAWILNLEKIKKIIKNSKSFDEVEEDCGSRIIRSKRIYNLDKYDWDN